MITVRKEEPKDHGAVFELVKAAFATVSYSDGSEASRVNENRLKESFIPELALVAEEGAEIVGYVVLHKMTIDYADRSDVQLEVAPLAVRPDRFKQGIGSALISKAHESAKELGYSAVFLLGNPLYYPRFGYEPTYRYNIYHVKDTTKSSEACMVKQLTPGYLGHDEGYIDIE